MDKKEKPRTIRMSDYLWRRIKEAAAKLSRTRSNYVRLVMERDSNEILKEEDK